MLNIQNLNFQMFIEQTLFGIQTSCILFGRLVTARRSASYRSTGMFNGKLEAF